MEQLLKKLKNTPIIKEESSEEEQLKYLEETGLNDIVNKGLVELYRVQPENPITYLASFLINEDNAKKIIESIEKSKTIKASLEEKQQKDEEYKKQMMEEKKKKEEEKEQVKEKLRETIKSCTDFEDKLNNICEQLKIIIGATGVYISSYEYKRKPIENITDDENAHIDPDNIKVLRYIHWNEDHNFLHGKYLPRKKGVTYSLFLKGQEGEDDEEEEGGEEAKEPPPQEGGGGDGEEGEGDEEEKDGQTKDQPIKMLEIPDVVNTKKVHFYREPRLGSYLCFNIGYKSSLNYNSLLSAIKNLQEYQVKNDEYEKAKAEKEEEEKQNAANEEENKDNDEGEDEEVEEKKEEGGDGEGDDEEKEKLIKPVLEDFEKEPKTLIISMDTLGQDRTFSESEKSFAQEISKLIRDSIESLEKQKLENDRDMRIDFLKLEKPLVEEWTVDKIEVEEENAVKDYTNSDDFLNKEITDEEGRRINEEFAKVQWSINTLTSGDFQGVLEMFEKFEFVQYEKAFQNIFYFAKTEPNLINEPETNKLYWKFAKAHWIGIFETLRNYTPLGAKPEKISPIFKGNFILENLNPFLAEDKVEALQEYSFVLYRLIKYIIDTLNTRKSDILWRHANQREAIKKRNEIIKNNKKIDAERKKALEDAKRQFNGEPEKVDTGRNDGEEEEEDEEVEEKIKKNNETKLDAEGNPISFNEEEFLQLYDQEHPKVPIPDEVKLDEDNDFDLEEEALPNEEEEEEGEEGDDDEKKQGDGNGEDEE